MKNESLGAWVRDYGWLLLILLSAAAFRFHDLADVPPGLTHDEADHGLTAWQIASAGLREIYFTVGYGREPLYDYLSAGLMAFLGPSFLAGRLVSAFASLIMIAAIIAWVRRGFGRSAALLTGAGLAVGFWPVMSGRQALRSILLPTLFALAVLIFWLAVQRVLADEGRPGSPDARFRQLPLFIAAGVLLGLTFYTYIPARALWLVFPALLIYWLLWHRDVLREVWKQTGIMLLVMLVVAAPLLHYLVTNPGAETRITQLAQPLLAARQGELGLLAQHAMSSLRLFFVEGDPAWRYNIAGRPLLGPLFGGLFLVGLLLLLWQTIRGDARSARLPGSAAFLSMAWLLLGFLPSLVTGPALSMTQAIGMQPMLYLLPAAALSVGGALLVGDDRWKIRPVLVSAALLLYGAVAVTTYRDYFIVWAESPEVRVQYEATMVAAIDYLNASGQGEVTVSTITPGPYHSPALAQMVLSNADVTLRWFDGRGSLLLPRAANATLVLPGFTPIPDALMPYLDTADLVETMPLRDTDLDRPLRFLKLDREAMSESWRERLTPVQAQFAENVVLTGYEIQPATAGPSARVNLVTAWQALQPLEGVVLFTHILGPEGVPIAQADQLDVPGTSWQRGDTFLQLHQMTLPPDISAGEYQVAVGVYNAFEGRRLVLQGEDGVSDLLPVSSLVVRP